MNADNDLQAISGPYLPLVEAEMQRALEGGGDSLLYQIIRYHLGLDQPQAEPRGKRIRPAVCLLACEAVGGRAEACAPAAAAVELAHAFTLIHDDVTDRDELRRGRPTVWRRWGVGQAITAGDAIYSLANLALARVDHLWSRRQMARPGAGEPAPLSAPADLGGPALQLLNQAVLAVCEGQQLDISFEGRSDVTVDDYLHMISLKTARLFATAAELGALIGGAAPDVAAAMFRFGHHLGLAFQIRDDILGIWGDSARTGKPVGGDLLRQKRSLPVVYALAHADRNPSLAKRFSEGVSTPEQAAQMAAEMEAAGCRAYCKELAAESLAHALAELDHLALRAPHGAALRQLASYLAHRTR